MEMLLHNKCPLKIQDNCPSFSIQHWKLFSIIKEHFRKIYFTVKMYGKVCTHMEMGGKEHRKLITTSFKLILSIDYNN